MTVDARGLYFNDVHERPSKFSRRTCHSLRNGLTFEEILDRNFTFESTNFNFDLNSNFQFRTDPTHDPDMSTLDGKEGSVLFKQKLLTERVLQVQKSKYNVTDIVTP